MAILENNQNISSYTVQSFLKDGKYNESYRIQDENGELFFLKIYDPQRVPEKILNSDSIITEIGFCEKMSHANVISYVEKGVFVKEDNKYPYLITKYVDGCLVADPLSKGRIFPLDMALNIAKMALQGLVHIHSLGLVHNDITPRNIMYNPKDLSKTTIIDLAHVSYPGNDVRTFETSDMTDFFRAPETYDFTFDERTDVFSMAAVLYAMLFGKAPWSNETTDKVTGASMLKELMLNRLSFFGSFEAEGNTLGLISGSS